MFSIALLLELPSRRLDNAHKHRVNEFTSLLFKEREKSLLWSLFVVYVSLITFTNDQYFLTQYTNKTDSCFYVSMFPFISLVFIQYKSKKLCVGLAWKNKKPSLSDRTIHIRMSVLNVYAKSIEVREVAKSVSNESCLTSWAKLNKISWFLFIFVFKEASMPM